ncbi:MAG: 2-polyprenylphenol 6-hydroxylase [candidate division NC10 bacterium]|nr:2-polyprenylphenol 6-hydroxylase [candidate division NC10 bacterium]
MPFARPIKRYKDIQRLRQIGAVLAKHGFGHLIVQLQLKHVLPLPRRFETHADLQAARLSISERARLAFEELGPTFIKFGQILSARPDLIPREFTLEFKKLQDEVPPFSFEEVRATIERELGHPLPETFPYFEEAPVAAASIAQVHHARLPSGEEVVVKVQRPGIERVIERDVSVLYTLASLLERYVPESRLYNPRGIVDEFAKAIRRELNFTREATAAERFRQNFQDFPAVYIPRVYWDQSTPRVLTMERVEGIPIDERGLLEVAGYDRARIAKNLADAFLRQVFEDGFFHGDPHPGNIFVLKGEGLALLDFGIVGRIDDDMKEIYASVFIALLDRDYDRLAEEILKVGLVSEEAAIKGFKGDLVDFVEPYYGRELAQIKVGRVISEAVELANRHRIKMPLDLVLLGKALLTIEGVARELDPHFNLLEVAAPYAKRLVRQRLSPERVGTDLFRLSKDYGELARVFPSQLRQVFNKILRDQVKVDFVHVGLENLIREMDRSSNRISFGLIIAALIVGSSLIMLSGKGPTLLGFPLLGIAGYVVAGIMGFWLAIAILRSGKL